MLLLFRIRIPELVFLNSYYVGTFSNAIEYSAYSAIAFSYSCACVIPIKQSRNPKKLPILNELMSQQPAS